MLIISLATLFFSLTTATYSPSGSRAPDTCQFPHGIGMVAVTPNKGNRGWAMSPDQKCTPGSYCPFACPPGQVMNQWDPSVLDYASNGRMRGGLYCNAQGKMEKRRPGELCVNANSVLRIDNQARQRVAFCQTVVPGNEAMLIETTAGRGMQQALAIPDTSYWGKTAAHYYVNNPGVLGQDACIWGDKSVDKGNWSPYVAGGNTNDKGDSFLMIGWNPKHLDDFCGKLPKFGIRIVCDDPKLCVGGPCEINPAKHGYNNVEKSKLKCSAVNEPKNAYSCIVTATKNSKARIQVFEV